jgi:hypothetical protein
LEFSAVRGQKMEKPYKEDWNFHS